MVVRPLLNRNFGEKVKEQRVRPSRRVRVIAFRSVAIGNAKIGKLRVARVKGKMLRAAILAR